ncbi:L,D-transpeptidase [Nocardioides montaniterrae]
MSLRKAAVATAFVVASLSLAGCGMDSSGGGSDDAAGTPTTGSSATSGSASASASTSVKPKPKPTPAGPNVTVSSIAPFDRATVGVAMPISVVFRSGVPDSEREAVEDAMKVTATDGGQGAWHWFSERRVDFRAKDFWKSGTTVTLTTHFGRATKEQTFTVGDDVRAHVMVRAHRTVVTKNGAVVRTMPSDAGSPDWPTWTGTMAVVNKEPTVQMDSCSVKISCDKGSSNYYNLSLPWDVRLTWSGTFLHYSPADPHPGSANGSHGCVHLSFADAKWFYNYMKVGDPVTVTGSVREEADPDNGYAAFNLTWQQWLAGSKAGAQQL